MKVLMPPQSGSQAGTTASRNRFGQYLRTRAMPVQPRTPTQTYRRSFLTNASSGWRALTDAQRNAWNVYASQLQRTDSLGQSYTPTGAELFVAAVGASLDLGLTDPPTVLPNYFLTVGSMAYVDPTPGPEALNVTLLQTNATNRFFVQTSGPVSTGITSAAAIRQWRTLPIAAASPVPQQYPMTATPVDIITEYKLLFPSPAVGQNIWFRFKEYFIESPAFIPNHQQQTFQLIVT